MLLPFDDNFVDVVLFFPLLLFRIFQIDYKPLSMVLMCLPEQTSRMIKLNCLLINVVASHAHHCRCWCWCICSRISLSLCVCVSRIEISSTYSNLLCDNDALLFSSVCIRTTASQYMRCIVVHSTVHCSSEWHCVL